MAGVRARFRKLEFLTLDQRLEVIRLSQQGLSQRGLAKKFKCGKTQIQNTLANKERFIAEWQDNEHNRQYKRRRGQPNESVNNLVLRWYLWAMQNDVPVTGTALQERAREYATELNVASFSASNGWLECFRRRHNIRFSKRSAASDSLEVPQAPPATQKQSAPPQQPPPSQKMVPPQQVSTPKQIAPKPTSTPVSPLQPLPPPPEVCLRWNSYHSNMQATFPSLLNNEQFVDVTLACEGRSIKCHKMMLSACSAYFEELLSQNPCQHPIVLMKDLKYWEVQALVDFMYRGEVNVAQDKLPSLLAAAEALQIKGLAGPAFSSHDDENTQSSAPLSSAEDYLDESTPSPSGSRRARKRRVMSSTQSPRTQAVQSPQVPVTPTRSTTGKRIVKPSLSMPSTSNYQHESIPSEPPARRPRKSESGELEIKIEPIDIEISNDSMDQMDDSFMEKTFDDVEGGDGGESSGQGDDPGGTGESKPSISSDTRINVHGHDADQMDFGNNSGTSRNDQNFRYEDSGSQDGMSAVPDLPGTSYQESLSQPSSSGINSSDNLLGRM